MISFDLTAQESARLDDRQVPVVYVSRRAPDRPSVYPAVAQPPADIGRTAGEMTRSLIDDPDAERAPHIEMPTPLIPRGSTAPLRAQEDDAEDERPDRA